MKKTDSTGIIPTEGLLSDMESLVIYGGKGIGTADPNDNNKYCGGANCQCIDPGKKDDTGNNDKVDCNSFCGVGTNCSCGKS